MNSLLDLNVFVVASLIAQVLNCLGIVERLFLKSGGLFIDQRIFLAMVR